MKHCQSYGVILVLVLMLCPGMAVAGEMGHSSHGHDMKAMDHSGKMATGHENAKGKMIRKATVNGYHLMYHLIDMKAQMATAGSDAQMHKMKNTHHLMVYLTDGEGRPVTVAKVGYLVKTQEGTDQKTMCMGMAGGFGADVDLSSAGMYQIKTKILDGENKIMDAFDFHVK